MQRREFIAGLGGAAVTGTLPAMAQQSKRLPVVALVTVGAPLANLLGADPVSLPWRGFVHGLRDLGWIDGRTVVIERRSTEDDPQRAPAMFAELIARGVDVFMLAGARWLQDAAQQATRTIPIVTHFPEDPVAAGLISTLANPGGNLTGVTSITGPEFFSKQLQLLLELAPGITRVVFLGPHGILDKYHGEGRPAGLTVVRVQVDEPRQYDDAFAAILRERADALIVSSGPINYGNARKIVAFAANSGLPAIYPIREAVEAGGLLCYGTSIPGVFRQAARLVDRFLKGANPGDIPTERATTFELVINGKTSKLLGLAIPANLLARADEVVE